MFALTQRSLKEMKEPPGDIWQWMQLPGWLDVKEPACQLRSRKRLRFVCVCVCVCVKLLQSCPTLCNPVVCSPPGSSVPGILRAGIPEWVAVPSSRSLCLYRLSNLTHLFHTVYHDLSILFSLVYDAGRGGGQEEKGTTEHEMASPTRWT